MIDRTISHYKILTKVGEGGMGVVYKATDTKLERPVALKFLAPHAIEDPEHKARFVREAKAAARLDHQNICPIYEIDEVDGQMFLAMAYLEGQTLKAKIAERPLKLDEALDIAVQTAQGLKAAHQNEVVHRDIKPANLMLTAQGQVKIMDFGLAQLADRSKLTKTTTMLGTPAYMSPEQSQRLPTDRRTDVWSLGVVIYEMVTGRLPFEGERQEAVLYAIGGEDPEPITALRVGVPTELDRIVGKAMSKEADERYPHIDDLLVDLRSLKKTSAASAGRAAAPEGRPFGLGKRVARMGPASRWSPGVALATGLALAATVFALYLTFFRPSPSTGPYPTIRPLTSFLGTEWQPSWSPDASFLAYAHANSGSADIWVMPARGGDPLRLTDHPADDVQPRWSPDGRYIAFVSDRGPGANVYLISPLGPIGTERELTKTNLHRDLAFVKGLGSQPWSPEGEELLFPRFQPDGGIAIWKINVATQVETQVTFPPPDSADREASWSFDGAWIAFEGRRDGKTGVWVIPAAGGEPRLLAEGGEFPTWSEDSRQLIFSSDQGGEENIWQIDIDSGQLRQLTAGPKYDRYPVVAANGALAYSHFTHRLDLYEMQLESGETKRLNSHVGVNVNARVSPDGENIAYRSDRTGNTEIWLLDLENKTERQLTDHPGADGYPDWSPDGRQIIFRSNRDGQVHLWVMDADGRSQRRLSEKSIPTSRRGRLATALRDAPRWSPDGQAIGYIAPAEGGLALWVVDPLTGKAVQSGLTGALMGFDWYRDSRHVIYSRMGADSSGEPEMLVMNLETGEEAMLHRGPHTEIAVARDGSGVTFAHALSHFNQNLYLLRLEPPAAEGGLPRPLGEAQQLTEGKGIWHVHNGGWAPDGKSVVYTHDADQGDIYLIENYR